TFGGDSFDWMDDVSNALGTVAKTVKNETSSAGEGLKNAMYSFTSGTYRAQAIKGGLSQGIIDLSTQLGPIGYVFTVISTSLIGQSLETMEKNLFRSDSNALAGVVTIGKDFMTDSISSLFKLGNFIMWWNAVQNGMKAIGSIPYIGTIANIIGG